jgi:hypothetical protein
MHAGIPTLSSRPPVQQHLASWCGGVWGASCTWGQAQQQLGVVQAQQVLATQQRQRQQRARLRVTNQQQQVMHVMVLKLYQECVDYIGYKGKEHVHSKVDDNYQ